MNAMARLGPIYFTNSDVPALCSSTIAELDFELIAAQYNRDAMKRIAMPRRHLSRSKALSPNQVISAMMQYLLIHGRRL